MIKNKKLFCVLMAILVSTVSACGGGGGGNTGGSGSTASNQGNGSQPYSIAYTDIHASSTISDPVWSGASVVDNMPSTTNAQTFSQSGWTGQITYGTASSSSTIKINNTAVANTSPISVVGASTPTIFDPYTLNSLPLGTNTELNLDGAYELCGKAPSGSISSNGLAATDILISGGATQVTNLGELSGIAGQVFHFNQYCEASTTDNQTLIFDASGNATFNLYTGSSKSGALSAVTIPASNFQAAMSGTPYGNAQQGSVTWTVYRFITASSQLKYVIVERGTADGGYIGMWY